MPSVLKIGPVSDGVGFIPTVITDAVITGVVKSANRGIAYDFVKYNESDAVEISGESLWLHDPYFAHYSNYDAATLEKHKNSFLEPKSLIPDTLSSFTIVPGVLNASDNKFVCNPMGYIDRTGAIGVFYGELVQAIAKVYNDYGALSVPMVDVTNSGTSLLFPSPGEMENQITGVTKVDFCLALRNGMRDFFVSRGIQTFDVRGSGTGYPSGGGVLTYTGINASDGLPPYGFQAFTSDPLMGGLNWSNIRPESSVSWIADSNGTRSRVTPISSSHAIRLGLSFSTGVGTDLAAGSRMKRIIGNALFGLELEGPNDGYARSLTQNSNSALGTYHCLNSDLSSWRTTIPVPNFGENITIRSGIALSDVAGLDVQGLSQYYPMLNQTEEPFVGPLPTVASSPAAFDLSDSWLPGTEMKTTRAPCTVATGFLRCFSPTGPSIIKIDGDMTLEPDTGEGAVISIANGSSSLAIPLGSMEAHLNWMVSAGKDDADIQDQLARLAGRSEVFYGTILDVPLDVPINVVSDTTFAFRVQRAREDVLSIKLSDADPVVTMRSARNRINGLAPQDVWVRTSDVMERAVQSEVLSNFDGQQDTLVIGIDKTDTQGYTGTSTLFLKNKTTSDSISQFETQSDAAEAYLAGFEFDSTIPQSEIDELLASFSVSEDISMVHSLNPYKWSEFDPAAFSDAYGMPTPQLYVSHADAIRRCWIAYKGFNNKAAERAVVLFARPAPE